VLAVGAPVPIPSEGLNGLPLVVVVAGGMNFNQSLFAWMCILFIYVICTFEPVCNWDYGKHNWDVTM